ncbi:MAG: zf-TFIIB domain-containing protein [Pirellula sp.]
MVSSSGEPRLCPCCRIPLEPRGRSGVNIDCCSQCHGVWLDRGELERIMERMYRNRVYRFDDEDAFESFDTSLSSDSPRSSR